MCVCVCVCVYPSFLTCKMLLKVNSLQTLTGLNSELSFSQIGYRVQSDQIFTHI